MNRSSTESGATLPEVNATSYAPGASPIPVNYELDSEYRDIALDCIVASPTNPRKRFNAIKMGELAASIKADEVHEPIVLRPLPADRLQESFLGRKKGSKLPTHELVSGERRWRASKLAGKATIPARIKRYTDEQVIRIQIVENKQRDDLHAMEEAEGYAHMMKLLKISADQVADEVGVSRATVYARMKLLDLTEVARTAFYAEQIDQSRALVIARIPDEKLQLKALEHATKEAWDGTVPSFRHFQRWVQDNLMLRLDKARFKITDAGLVPTAGSCSNCPKRTGAAPELFADVDCADVCTDPKCFHEKQALHDEQQLTRAKESGHKIITGEQAKRIWPYEHSDTLNGFKRLDRADPRVEGKKTLKKLLGKECPEPTLLQSPHNGSLIEVVAEEKVTQLLKDLGLLTPAQARASREISAVEAKAKVEEKYQRTWRKRAIEQCYQAVRKDGAGGMNMPIVRLLAKMMLQGLVGDDRAHTAQLLEVGKVGDQAGIDTYIDDCTESEVEGVMLLLFMQHDMHFNSYSGIKDPARIMAVADDYAVDLKAIRDEVQEEMKAAIKKPAKPLLSLASAAQAKGGGGDKGQKSGTPAAPASVAPLRKRKLTADEAQAAIAAAMQGQDTNPGADAQGIDASSSQPVATAVADAPSEALAVGIEVGKRVRITLDDDKLGLIARKWGGKEGLVTKREDGGGFWHVTFRGRNGGSALFAEDQIASVGEAVTA